MKAGGVGGQEAGRKEVVMKRLRGLRGRWQAAQLHARRAMRVGSGGWQAMQRDLEERKKAPRWHVTGARARRSQRKAKATQETLVVMDHADAATSHTDASGNGRKEQRVYRGPNSEIAHAPTHERLGRGWYGPDQGYNFPGHWRYYKDTHAKMAPKVLVGYV